MNKLRLSEAFNALLIGLLLLGITVTPGLTSPSNPQEDTITVNYLPNGSTDAAGTSCLEWPTNARTAFEYARLIWSPLVSTSAPLVINACWADLGAGEFGYVEAGGYFERGGAPQPGLTTWYPAALANALSGTDVNGGSAEIHITYNKNYPWYFPTDGNPAVDKYDFVTAVLQQICHGLGFRGFMKVEAGEGYWQFSNTNPAIYDRFIENGGGQTLISFPNQSTSLATQLQSNDLYFDGYSAGIANEGTPPQLYAPDPWQPNISYIHLVESYHDTDNGLMTPLAMGKAYHDPGPVALGILRDVGWNITRNTKPLLINLPDQELPMNSSRYKALDLWEYASDSETADDARLAFFIETPTPHISLSKDEVNDNMRYLNLHPPFGETGEMLIVIRVEDPEGLSDTDTFSLNVTNTPPTLADIPDILAPTNLYTQVLDLRRYTTDKEDVKSSLVFSITADSNPAAGVAISANRFIEISPTVGFLGTTDITVQVRDTGQATATNSFNVMITDQNITPTVHISDKRIFVNHGRQIDLWDLDWDGENDYARDPEGLPITITISNSPDVNAGVAITQNRYIAIEPAHGWIGQTDVEIQATDPSGLSGVDSFRVTVWTPVSIYLPLITRNYGVIEEGRQYLYPFE